MLNGSTLTALASLVVALGTAFAMWRVWQAEQRKTTAELKRLDQDGAEALLEGHGRLRVALLEEVTRLRKMCEHLELEVAEARKETATALEELMGIRHEASELKLAVRVLEHDKRDLEHVIVLMKSQNGLK